MAQLDFLKLYGPVRLPGLKRKYFHYCGLEVFDLKELVHLQLAG